MSDIITNDQYEELAYKLDNVLSSAMSLRNSKSEPYISDAARYFAKQSSEAIAYIRALVAELMRLESDEG